MRVPPGVSEKDFADAVRQFEEVVGLDWVFTIDEDLDLYRDAYSPYKGEPEELVASAAVAPANVEEVSKVVKIANTCKIPIYAISTGRNMGYGHCAPVYSGSVVLDLKRMNRIIEVNEKNAYCVVEPGVNYFDLYRYVHEKGYRLLDSMADNCFGGLIGNSLDHGVGYMPPEYSDHFSSHCGMEVVLANGEIIRTGMGALPNSKIWQQYKYGLGPYVDGIFGQGNFGVVTKMGFWMYPQPEAFYWGRAYVPRQDDLHRLVEIQQYLQVSGISNGFSRLGSPLLSGQVPVLTSMESDAAVPQQDPDPELNALRESLDARKLSPEFEKYALRKGVPYWRCELSFYGTAKVVSAQWEYAKERFSAIPGAKFENGELVRFPLTPEYIQTLPGGGNSTRLGVPSLTTFQQSIRGGMNPIPPVGHIWFAPLAPRTGEAIFEVNRVFGQFGAETGLPPFLPSTFRLPSGDWCGPRVFLYLFAFREMADVETSRRYRQGYRNAVKLTAEHGWGEYRAHPVFYNEVMAELSYNNHALTSLHETIKDTVDPNGILSPGRYGIWPKHLRHMKDPKRS